MTDQVPSPLDPHPEDRKAPAPPPRRSLGLQIAKWTGIVVLGLIVLVTVILFLPQTRQFAFDYGRGILKEAGVESSSITGSWSEMTLRDVAIVDETGAWATAREIVISWSPFGLVSGQLSADRIEIRGANLLRQPAYKPDPAQADEPFAWPDLPVDVTLASLTGDITIDPSFVGESITAAINGKADLTSAGGSAEVSLNRTDGVPGEAAVSARTNSNLDDIAIQINAKDARIAARLAGDERFQNIEVALQATRAETTCTGQASVSARDGALATVGVNPNCTFAIGIVDVAKFLDASAGLLGPANLSIQLLEDGTDQTTQIKVAADASKIQSTDEMLARILPGASASGLVTFLAGGIKVDELAAQLAGGTVQMGGSASLIDNVTKAQFGIVSSDLSALRPDLKGQAQVRVTYDTASATPVVLEGSGTNIASGQLNWKTIGLNGSLTTTGGGEFVLKGDGPVPIDLTASFVSAFGPGLQATAKGTVAGANLDVTAAGLTGGGYDVSGRVDTKRLDLIGQLAGIELAGALTANGKARVGSTADSVTLKASLTGGRYGTTQIGNATLDADGPLTALNVRAEGRLPVPPRQIDYRVAALVRDFAVADVDVLRVSTSTGETLDVTGPFKVSFADDILVDGLNARILKGGRLAGQIAASANQSASGIRTSVQVTNADLEALTAITGRAVVRGRLDATAELDGAAGRATLKATIDELRAIGAAGRAPPADIDINGNWNGGRFAITATARAAGLPDARAELSFPLARAPGGGFPTPAANPPLDGRVTWNGRIAPIWRLLDIAGHDLDGDASIDVAIGGTLGNPIISGDAVIANGNYLNDAFGTRLVNLGVRVNARADRINVTGEATDGGRGRLRINAALSQTGLGGASGGLTLENMQLLAEDNLSARISGALNLAPGQAGPTLGGNLTVTDLQAGIPEPTAPDLVTVDVIDPAKPPPPAPVGQPKAVDASNPAAADLLYLNINVAIPGPAEVRGRGINSLWNGNITVRGDIGNPLIGGKIELLRGTLDFGPRTFELTEGEVVLDGSSTIDPRIKIVATQEQDDFTGRLSLTGRISDLKIEATSDPAAPQDEVLARLLFGKSVSTLSALEALELANSVASLSGQTGDGGGLLGNLKDRFGLDVLAIEGLGDEGGPTIKAGTYLSDKTYFEVRQGGANGGTVGRLEIEIDEDFSVETEIGADAASSAGVRYGFDY